MAKFEELEKLVDEMPIYSRKLLTTALEALVERLSTHVDKETCELIARQVLERTDMVFFPPQAPRGKQRQVWGN